MKEERISLVTAKLAKEKGFDVGCNGSYTEFLKTHKSDNPSFAMKKGEIEFDGSFYFTNNSPMSDFSNENYTMYSAPTQSLLQKWLREKHGLILWIEFTGVENLKWVYIIFGIPREYMGNSYEECLEVGLQKALELIK